MVLSAFICGLLVSVWSLNVYSLDVGLFDGWVNCV